MRGWKKLVYLLLSGICLLLATAGILLPGLPTTPFLLLTSYFLVRCSPRLNEALLRSALFGPLLTDWQVRGGVRPDVKVKAIAFVVLAVSATVYFSGLSAVIRVAVIFLATIGIGIILKLPTVR